MPGFVIAVLGLGGLCAGWVVLQRWLARVDPDAPGVEGRCGSCHTSACEDETLTGRR